MPKKTLALMATPFAFIVVACTSNEHVMRDAQAIADCPDGTSSGSPPLTPIDGGSVEASSPPPATPSNSVDTIVDDMLLMNDLPLAGVPSGPGWAKGPGQVVMGNNPRGSGTPSWWNPSNKFYKGDAYWNEILPWLVIFDGVGNEATNTRVELRHLKVFLKSKATGQWQRLSELSKIGGELYPKHLQGEQTTRPDRRESDAATSVKPPGGDLVFHGWGEMSTIVPQDVRAVVVTVEARLARDDASKPDDAAKARYLLQVGADYYPTRETRVSAFAPANYNPGVGLSRSKLISSEWRSFNFATLDVGMEDPGGASITVDELRAAPPPL